MAQHQQQPLSPSDQRHRKDDDTDDHTESAISTAAPTPFAVTPLPRPGRQRRGTEGHTNLVFADPVAFRYLEEDPATLVLDRRRRLEGYEIYVVEQWVCSRSHPTFLITTYTGDASRSIMVGVLSVPSDRDSWSPRLKLYFDALEQYHAKQRDTPLGTIMVTNLSSFPSSLTVIAVPDGDVKKHREDFLVNEDLKRMGCSGRAAINLQPPTSSTVAKFHQLYHTSETAGIYQAVLELVRLCQISLLIYGKLPEVYTDGLLCDLTEKAIREWWTEIGYYFYNIEPSDGVLGPTTVAALLGLLIGAYSRMKAYGVAVPKDLFDMSAMKRAIGSFQKGSKVEKTRRLDRDTLDRLHRATAKSASGEGWGVPKAVKSTVAELSGKGGEMVMGIVGGREKAPISEVETLDIDRLSQLVVGSKMKWLWQGKSKPSDILNTATSDEPHGKVFSTDDQGGFIWTSNNRDSVTAPSLERAETLSSQHGPENSRLGRIRGAARGLKHHGSKQNIREDDIDEHEHVPRSQPYARPKTPDHEVPARTVEYKPLTGPAPMNMALRDASPTNRNRRRGVTGNPTVEVDRSHRQMLRASDPPDSPRKRQIKTEITEIRRELDSEVYRDFSAEYSYSGPRSKALRRSQSVLQVIQAWPYDDEPPRQNRISRHLSFSMVEASVLTYPSVVEDEAVHSDQSGGLVAALARRDSLATDAQKKTRRILRIQDALVPYAEMKVGHVENLDRDSQTHLQELNELYYQKLEEYQTLRATSSDVVGQEKHTLHESLRRVEMLGAKLDYELNSLQSRIQEVEDGVDEFEKNVVAIEARVKELAGEETRETVPWFQRLVYFVGSGKVRH